MLKEDLSNKNIDFEYHDIISNLLDLKGYLHYRDNLKEFDTYKQDGKLGIPLIIVRENDSEKVFIERYKADFL